MIFPRRLVPTTTYYNRFVRWRRAGVWNLIVDALAATHDVVGWRRAPTSFATNYLAFVQLASILLWLADRYESTPKLPIST